jgi:hypothetical protein
VSVDRSGHRARVAVENQGPPLPPEGEAIFDLFASFRAQTNPASKRGFGLYVVRLIAERSGGGPAPRTCRAGRGRASRSCCPRRSYGQFWCMTLGPDLVQAASRCSSGGLSVTGMSSA